MRTRSLVLSIIVIFLLAVAALIFDFPELGKQAPGMAGWLPDFPFKLGLDLQGGAHFVYEADMTTIPSGEQSNAINGLRDVLERRVNLFGVKEPIVQVVRAGESYRLIVELAGVIDPAAAIELIGQTPFLEFKQERPAEETQKILDKRKEFEGKSQQEIQKIPDWQLGLEDPYFTSTQLTGRYLKEAQLGFDHTTNEPLVLLQFNDDGAKIFEELTEKNIGKRLAIYIDGLPISAPVVQDKISGGRAQITGRFTIDEARNLARNLAAGALPVPISLISQAQVGPTLGKISLEKSLKAGLAGFALIFAFMFGFYRLPGLVSSLALAFYVLFALALFKLIGVTLTLAGIAGFILSIGMAIDANILILARLREERALQSDLSRALENAVSRAWPAIRDGNLTTLMVTVILFSFGSSFVQGFALTLSLGILVSIVVSMVVSRLLLYAVSRSRLSRLVWLWQHP